MLGKGLGRCRGLLFAVRPDKMHGKGAFAVRLLLCRVLYFILFVFLSILFHLILIFIFLLVSLFDEYLLVLLKTMCNTKLLSMFIPHIYQGFGAINTRFRKSAKCYRPNVRKVTPGSYFCTITSCTTL
jgi:hypothetical protein